MAFHHTAEDQIGGNPGGLERVIDDHARDIPVPRLGSRRIAGVDEGDHPPPVELCVDRLEIRMAHIAFIDAGQESDAVEFQIVQNPFDF